MRFPCILHVLPVNIAPADQEEGTSFLIPELYKYLKRKYKFLILSKKPKSEYKWSLPAEFIKIPEPLSFKLPYSLLKKVYTYKLKRFIPKKEWDIAFFYEELELPIRIKKMYPDRKVGIRICSPWSNEKINSFDLKEIEKIDAFVFCSKWLKRYFLIYWKSKKLEKKIHVIYNAVDGTQFSPVWGNFNWRKYMRKRFNMEEKFIILFAGRISPEKGVHLLIDSLNFIAPSLLGNIKILLLGDVWYGRKYKTSYYRRVYKAVKKYRDNISFLGFIPRDFLKYFYWMSDLVVIPSQVEAFCRVALEAMACGIPVLSTKTEGTKEVLKDAGIFANHSAKDIASKIAEIMENKKKRAEKGLKGRERVEKMFLWDKVSKKWDSLFYSMIEG